MKKLILCASVFALAACGGSEAEPEAMEDTAAMEEAAAPAGDGAVLYGTFDLAYADGTSGTVTVSEDGSYVSTAGDQTSNGVVEDVDGQACFDPEGDAPPQCWTQGETAEDGSFTSTSDDGTVVKVTPTAAE
ncbi:hypothetical protein ACRAQ6_10955 [Erythrobacter sp. HA6-11]